MYASADLTHGTICTLGGTGYGAWHRGFARSRATQGCREVLHSVLVTPVHIVTKVTTVRFTLLTEVMTVHISYSY